MKRVLGVLVAFITPSTVAVSAEPTITVSLDRLTSADRTAIHRGNSVATGKCFEAVLTLIKRQKIPRKEVIITFEDPEFAGVTIAFADTDSNYACINGEMRSYEAGEFEVIRRFKD